MNLKPTLIKNGKANFDASFLEFLSLNTGIDESSLSLSLTNTENVAYSFQTEEIEPGTYVLLIQVIYRPGQSNKNDTFKITVDQGEVGLPQTIRAKDSHSSVRETVTLLAGVTFESKAVHTIELVCMHEKKVQTLFGCQYFLIRGA